MKEECEKIPGKRAVFHSFLAVLSPSIPIVQMIDLTLCHESKSWFSLPFLIFLFWFQSEKINIKT